MNLSIFQIVNYLLIVVIFVILGRYVWSMIFDRNYQPIQWQKAVKGMNVPSELIRIEKSYPDKVRFFNWWFQVDRLKKEKVVGSFAELGVYKGDSAKILFLMDPGRKLHLFDTFAGLPEKDLAMEHGEAATYTPVNFADTSIEKVKKNMGMSADIEIHEGYFPETTKGLENECFALVNMDADLYNPTIAGLEFFYPRLSPGGVILVHDYNHKWEGVIRAVDEFAAKIPESVISLPDMDGTVMIIKNKSVNPDAGTGI